MYRKCLQSDRDGIDADLTVAHGILICPLLLILRALFLPLGPLAFRFGADALASQPFLGFVPFPQYFVWLAELPVIGAVNRQAAALQKESQSEPWTDESVRLRDLFQFAVARR